jgi:hypothetical protein
LDTAKVFLEKTKTMSADDQADFDLARKNGDAGRLQRLIVKYKMGKEYYGIRKMLNDIHERARAVGFEIGYREHYHPRKVKDATGFVEYLHGREDWSIIEEAIQQKEHALQRYLTVEEKAELINSMIRGYNRGKIGLSETGNMKDREIEFVDARLNQFYYDSNAALVRYLSEINQAIESRRFFGKGSKELGFNNIEDSIGAYVTDLIAKETIHPSQEKELRDILQARFGAKSVGPLVGLYRNLAYIDTMGSPISAITQIGDLAFSLYRGGAVRTVFNFGKAVLGASDLSKRDIGVEKIAEEFSDAKKSATALAKVFKWVGLEKMDALGKETLINTVIQKYRSQAKQKTPPADFMERIQAVFGEDTFEVLQDLKDGQTTENVKLLAFNELLNVQPIALSEMPEKYLSGGNGRVFYMLKTYTLKQFDVFRNEVFQQLQKPGKANKIEGLRRLTYLAAALIMANGTADMIKNLILNRPIYWPDTVADNIFRLFGLSKYTVYSARNEGLGTAAVKTVLPPIKFLDSAYRDFVKYNPDKEGPESLEGNFWKGKKLETTASIPLFGKMYYWWLGKGVEKSAKTRKKIAKKERLSR